MRNLLVGIANEILFEKIVLVETINDVPKKISQIEDLRFHS